MICWDTETNLSTPEAYVPDLVCLSTWHNGQGNLYHADELQACQAGIVSDIFGVLPLLSSECFVGHYLAFDFSVIVRKWPELWPAVISAYDQDRVTDTGLRDKLFRNSLGTLTLHHKSKTDGFSLAAVMRRCLGVHVEKENTWRLRYGELRHVPLIQWPVEAYTYPIDDARHAFNLWAWQEERIAPEILRDQHRQARADFWLYLCRAWGLVTDEARITRLEQAIREEHRGLGETLTANGLLERKFKRKPSDETKRNAKLAGERLIRAYQSRGLDYPRSDGGGPALDKTACAESGDPVLDAYGKYSALNTVLTKDVPMLRRGVIRSRYEVLQKTGRTSSSDPNVQNWKVLLYGPPGNQVGIRECCKPRPGFIYASADYSGLELCTFAQVCIDLFGRSRMAEIINAGKDCHLEIAAQLRGISYDEAKARNDAKDKPTYLARQTGKVANFGIPGGLGATSLVSYAKELYKVEITEDQARALKRLWLDTYPEGRLYFRYVSEATAHGEATIVQHRSGRLRGGCSYTEMANTFFQGLGADLAKAAGWALAKECYAIPHSPLYGSRIVGFFHDEFMLEVPDIYGIREPAAERLGQVMVEAARPWIPDVTIKAKPALHYIWSKDAEPRHDPHGVLIPWHPQ